MSKINFSDIGLKVKEVYDKHPKKVIVTGLVILGIIIGAILF